MKRLVDALAPGMRVFVSTLTTESAVLQDELRADPERARGVTFTGVQFFGIDHADYLAVHPEARQLAYFMSPSIRTAMAQGRAELLSLDHIGIVRQLREEAPVDLAIAQLTLPDADGFCSPGLACDFMPLAWARAKKKVAHLNPRLPRTRGSFRVHVSELDDSLEADAPLLEYSDAAGGEVETRIGVLVAGLVRDGDTLQFGIGSVPVALASSLAAHRKLRIHGGMITPSMGALWDKGAIDRDARITTGVVLGDRAFHERAAHFETLWMTDASHTHSIAQISAIPRFMAINSAIEVDLFGQVNAERAGGAIKAGPGGLPAFAMGALGSPGGHLLTCLASTAKGGSISKIVPALDAQAVTTLPRYLTDIVVTEHGVAELRNLSLDARAQALIAIAAPEHRNALSNAWGQIRAKA